MAGEPYDINGTESPDSSGGSEITGYFLQKAASKRCLRAESAAWGSRSKRSPIQGVSARLDVTGGNCFSFPKTRRAASPDGKAARSRVFLGALLAELVPDDQSNDENEDGKGRISEGNRHITRPGEVDRRYNL